MPAYKSDHADIGELIQALSRQLDEAAQLSSAARIDAARQRFGTYQQFRDKVGEFQTLSVIVEGRFRSRGDAGSRYRAEYEDLETRMLALLIGASMRFFLALASNDVLPLGARDVFLTELRSLRETHAKLSAPQYEGRLDASVRADLDAARKILTEIIEKAPSLLQFEKV